MIDVNGRGDHPIVKAASLSPVAYEGGRFAITVGQQYYAGITGDMSEIHTLALRQADQARTDCALIESDLEVIQKQLARLPTHR